MAFVSQPTSVIRFSMPGAISGAVSGQYGIMARHNLRSAPAPTFTGADSVNFDVEALSYSGNVYLSSRGTGIVTCMLAPVGLKWMPQQVASPTLPQLYTVEVGGTKAHFTPE